MTIQETIIFLEQKAEKYRKKAEALLMAAASLREDEGENNPSLPMSKVGLGVTTSRLTAPIKGTSRVEQLRGFIKLSGALRTGEIIKRSGIPAGSISTLLKPENGFEKGKDGRWNVQD